MYICRFCKDKVDSEVSIISLYDDSYNVDHYDCVIKQLKEQPSINLTYWELLSNESLLDSLGC